MSFETDASTLVRRPARTSSALAVAASVLAIAVVADTSTQRWILVAAVVGVAIFTAGGHVWHRGGIGTGVVVTLAGALVVVAALALAATRPAFMTHRLELIPGLVGLWLLAAGVLPVRAGWERTLIDAGTGMVFLTVLVSGVVRGASLGALLVAGVLTILAWDAAENAVSVGEQLGIDASTTRGELVHSAASAAVGLGAILLVSLVQGLGITGLPFAALAALLVAGVALVLVYHR